MTKQAKELIYKNKKYKEDPKFRLDRKLRSFLNRLCIAKKKGNTIVKSKYLEILGFTFGDFISHMELCFLGSKMSWDNYGEWHIDHIIPVSWFQYESIYSPKFLKCWNLDNLQPLWREDNLHKASRRKNV